RVLEAPLEGCPPGREAQRDRRLARSWGGRARRVRRASRFGRGGGPTRRRGRRSGGGAAGGGRGGGCGRGFGRGWRGGRRWGRATAGQPRPNPRPHPP